MSYILDKFVNFIANLAMKLYRFVNVVVVNRFCEIELNKIDKSKLIEIQLS